MEFWVSFRGFLGFWRSWTLWASVENRFALDGLAKLLSGCRVTSRGVLRNLGEALRVMLAPKLAKAGDSTFFLWIFVRR